MNLPYKPQCLSRVQHKFYEWGRRYFCNLQSWPALATELVHSQKRVIFELIIVVLHIYYLQCNLSTNPNDFKYFSCKMFATAKVDEKLS